MKIAITVLMVILPATAWCDVVMLHGKNLQISLTRKQYKRVPANLFRSPERPKILTNKYGLLVERDFGGQQ